jgi:hypothetical protein
VFPVPWSSKWNWSLYLFLGRPTFLRPFGLYCNACFGIPFVLQSVNQWYYPVCSRASPDNRLPDTWRGVSG